MAEDRIKCPICAELIQPGAKKCRFCGEWLAGSRQARDGGVFSKLPEPPGDEREEEHEEEIEGSEKDSPEAEPVEMPKSLPVARRRRFPWLRIILFIAYAAIVVALVCSERNARRLLHDAEAKEEAQDYQAAFDEYTSIIQRFPFSLAVVETQQGLKRLSESHGFPMPRPSWLDPVEDVLGEETNVCGIYLLSFVAWPACAVLLALVFLTRILRPGTALFVLVLLAVAIAGSVAQLSWYGRLLSKPVAKGLLEEPVVLYSVTYALLVVTALMTLTATRKRKIRNKVLHMATATR